MRSWSRSPAPPAGSTPRRRATTGRIGAFVTPGFVVFRFPAYRLLGPRLLAARWLPVGLLVVGWVAAGSLGSGLPAPAFAGVNKDGRLVLHATKDLNLTRDGEDRDLRSCESAVTTLPGDDSEVIIFLLAAFPDWVSPAVTALLFGIDYDTTVHRSGRGIDYGWELPTTDWPGPGSGNAVTYGTGATIDDRITTVYWFGAYAYQGTTFRIIDHPVQGRPQFADDSVPAILDEVRSEDLGKIGFGVPGYNPCLANVPTGGCCYSDGVCAITAEIACEDEDGTYLGNDSGCDVYACLGACCLETGDCSQERPQDCDAMGGWFRGVRVECRPGGCLNERVTWGELKRAYREDY